MKTFKLLLLIGSLTSLLLTMPVQAQDLSLPEALKSNDGSAISTPDAWSKNRRAEILRLFEDHMYGQVPKDFESIKFRTVSQDKMAMNGKAILKQVAIDVNRKGQSVTINLVLFVPADAEGPAPLFLLINHRGKENTDPTRNFRMEFWPAEEVVARGYAVAAFHVSEVAPDNKKIYNTELLRLYPEQTQQGNGMKAIGAWGWGASRVMDYLQTDADIDARKVAVVGHSRGGKAALWCGAQDERFAIAISNNSGCTGAALARRKMGERVADINKGFPYWFCDNYNEYNNDEDSLPVDQHMLLALMAPRAVYVASASQDAWADPKGEFLSVKYAEPVFKLFSIAPLPAKEQPGVNSPVKSVHLGYHLRDGGHGLFLYDWQRYMDFADAYYNSKRVTKK
jgi:dienelactone hydrolase